MNKQPERTARTKRNLADAFWSTAEEKGIRRVTVSDVTKSAGLNRGTFYEYYTDIPSLTEEAEEEILSELRQQMKTALAALGQNDPHLSSAGGEGRSQLPQKTAAGSGVHPVGDRIRNGEASGSGLRDRLYQLRLHRRTAVLA